MPLRRLAAAVGVVCVWVGGAQAGLIERGHGMVYDTATGITWLKDANFPKTLGVYGNGYMSPASADDFCQGLVWGGHEDWQLPYSSYYPSGGDLEYLYTTSLGNNYQVPTHIAGPFTNLAWTNYYVLCSDYNNVYQYFKYAFGSTNLSLVGPAYSWESYGVLPCHSGDVSLDASYDSQLLGGSFAGSLYGWDSWGSGSVTVTTYSVGVSAARMETGSPVYLAQLFDTPAEAFTLGYQVDMTSWSAALNVYLNGTLIDTIGSNTGGLIDRQIEITNPALLGLTSAELKYELTAGSAGQVAYLANVQIVPEPIPEPATLTLLALGALALIRRRRS